MWQAIALGAGIAMQGLGKMKANADQADAEEKNAAFYREQADFAAKAGERQRMIFDRESVILFGEQASAFAKAGIDTSGSGYFLAQQNLFRAQESNAIQEETDMNVRLATLRAEQADATADALNSQGFLETIAGPALMGLGSF